MGQVAWDVPDVTVDFVFDRKEKVRGHVHRYLDELRTATPRVGAVSFADSCDTVPLQAADHLAFERRLRTERRVLRDKRPERMSYVSMREARIGKFRVIDERFGGLLGDPRPVSLRIPYEPD